MVFEDAPEDVLEPAIAYDQNVFEECEESVGHDNVLEEDHVEKRER